MEAGGANAGRNGVDLRTPRWARGRKKRGRWLRSGIRVVNLPGGDGGRDPSGKSPVTISLPETLFTRVPSMRRQFLMVGLLLAAVLGCSKEPPTPIPNSTEPGAQPSGQTLDPNATYTITFRGVKKGDRHRIVKARDATAEITNQDAKTTETKKEEFRYDYTETILETSPDEPRPTKVTRVYTIARKNGPDGKQQNASYVGKTITIERYLQGYKYSVEGESLPPLEQHEIAEDFVKGSWKLDNNLPDKPVKVGDQWEVDFASITSIAGAPQKGLDIEKSKITGRLVRVYEKDGRRWGVIELKILMVIDTVATNGSPIKGEVTTTGKFEIVIDGSSREGKMTMDLKSVLDNRNSTGQRMHTTIQGTEERSISPAE